METIYTGIYKVVKFFKISNRRQVLRRGLTLEEAKRVVNSYLSSSPRSFVDFTKEFTAKKYFKTI